jgi:hypothetical protein
MNATRLILGLTLSAASLAAQTTPADPSADVAGRPTIPPAARLAEIGQVATPAAAKPLIAQYYAEQEQLLQARRALIVSLQGKTPEEGLKLMQAHVEAQKERRQRQRQLEAQIGAMLKKDREDKAKPAPRVNPRLPDNNR